MAPGRHEAYLIFPGVHGFSTLLEGDDRDDAQSFGLKLRVLVRPGRPQPGVELGHHLAGTWHGGDFRHHLLLHGLGHLEVALGERVGHGARSGGGCCGRRSCCRNGCGLLTQHAPSAVLDVERGEVSLVSECRRAQAHERLLVRRDVRQAEDLQLQHLGA